MGIEKEHQNALRWLETAVDDLDAALILHEAGSFALACFHAQQCAEKAIKAVWHSCDLDPWGHSIRKLIQEFPQDLAETKARLSPHLRGASVLDRYYIGTRYPDGLPDSTPGEVYGIEDSRAAIDFSRSILDAARGALGR